MATFTKNPGGWYAQVRRKGHKSIGRTLNTKAEAEIWAASVESKMGVGTYMGNRETLTTSLAECFGRYEIEIIPHKKSAEQEMHRSKMWREGPLGIKSIGTIKQSNITKWRDARITAGKSGPTVRLDLAILSHLFTTAIKERGFPPN